MTATPATTTPLAPVTAPVTAGADQILSLVDQPPLVLHRPDKLPTDGRAARSHRTMERIVAAMVDLIENDGALRPTADQVAAQADVSRRALYLHFDSLEEVFSQALQRRTSEVLADWEWPTSVSSTEARIGWFTTTWANLVESLTPFCTAASQFEPSSPVVADAVEEVRAWMRAASEATFRAELSRFGPDERGPVTTALHFLTSCGAWTDLRRQGADRERAAAALAHLLRSLLVPR